MAKNRIRITGAGIHGAPTLANPTGEFPIGHEFETDADLPAGWVGRAEIVGEKPKAGSVFLTGADDDSEVGKARREVADAAQKQFDKLQAEHVSATQAIIARAERAEADLQAANKQIEALNLKIAGLEKPPVETATADEIKSAVALLDKGTDAHWTTTGLPAVDAVAELTGKTVTRKAIDEAAPGTKRPA